MISDANKTTDIQTDIVTKDDASDLTLSTGLFGGSGGTCPSLPPIVVFGNSFELDQAGTLCTILDWTRALVLLSAYFAAFKIISR